MLSKISASAMKYGLILGVYFALNFLFSVSGNTFLALFSNVILVLSILFVYRYTVKFRETENDGVISYRNAFFYILMLHFFGSILSGAVVLIYNKFINPGFLTAMINDPSMQKSIEILKTVMKFSDSQVQQSLDMIMNPVSYTLQYIWGNTVVGAFIGLVLAFAIKKSPKNQHTEQ